MQESAVKSGQPAVGKAQPVAIARALFRKAGQPIMLEESFSGIFHLMVAGMSRAIDSVHSGVMLVIERRIGLTAAVATLLTKLLRDRAAHTRA